MRLLSVLLFFAFLSGGCTYLHKPESTHFVAKQGGFTFRAIADAAYPEGWDNAEAWRIKWLEQRLEDTESCPRGNLITSRETELLSTRSLGSIYDVNYEGRCT